MRHVDVITLLREEPGAAFHEADDRRPLRGQGLTPLGDVGADVRGELLMEPADQPLDAGPLQFEVARRDLLERRDGRASAVMVEDQLVPSPDVCPLIEGDVDDLARALTEIAVPATEGPMLAIPASSVIDSGARQMVLIDRGGGRFEPRPVRLGTQGGDFVQVTEGVKVGEKIVTSANFLIDAESNLRAALQGFTSPNSQSAPGARP